MERSSPLRNESTLRSASEDNAQLKYRGASAQEVGARPASVIRERIAFNIPVCIFSSFLIAHFPSQGTAERRSSLSHPPSGSLRGQLSPADVANLLRQAKKEVHLTSNCIFGRLMFKICSKIKLNLTRRKKDFYLNLEVEVAQIYRPQEAVGSSTQAMLRQQ